MRLKLRRTYRLGFSFIFRAAFQSTFFVVMNLAAHWTLEHLANGGWAAIKSLIFVGVDFAAATTLPALYHFLHGFTL